MSKNDITGDALRSRELSPEGKANWDLIFSTSKKEKEPMTTDIPLVIQKLPYVKVAHVGSRVTCSPPPEGTDDDWLVLTDDPMLLRQAALEDAWGLGGSMVLDASLPLDAEDRFSSYTLGELNVIATSDTAFFERFLAATAVAKRLNLLDKEDRIALFQAVLYANYEEQP